MLDDLISAAKQREAEQQAARHRPLIDGFAADLATELADPVRDTLDITYHWEDERGPVAVFHVDSQQWSIHATKTGTAGGVYDLPAKVTWVVQLEGTEVFTCTRSQLQDKLLLAIGQVHHH